MIMAGIGSGSCGNKNALYNWFAVKGITVAEVIPYTLYNRYAASKNGGTGVGSIAPAGWHVPTFDEWRTLVNYISPPYGYYPSHEMREVGTIHWTAPNTGATNSSGFTLLPAGIRLDNGIFEQLRTYTTLHYISDTYTFAGISFDESDFYYQMSGNENFGLSVRCLLDGVNPDDPGTITDIDGNVYPTAKIGTQVWMAVNLVVAHFNNGDAIPIVTDNTAWAALTSEGMCYYNNLP
jgi:uncharacterized protein (TIGR02145 family)